MLYVFATLSGVLNDCTLCNNSLDKYTVSAVVFSEKTIQFISLFFKSNDVILVKIALNVTSFCPAVTVQYIVL